MPSCEGRGAALTLRPHERDVGVKLGRTMSEQDHSRRLEQWSVWLEQPGRAVAREDRQVHVGRLAGWGALPVEEIRVPVNTPESAAAGQCLANPEQERAVTAQDKRTVARLQRLAHARGDCDRRPAHFGCGDHAGDGVTTRGTDARLHLSAIAPVEPLDQPGRAERSGSAFLPTPAETRGPTSSAAPRTPRSSARQALPPSSTMRRRVAGSRSTRSFRTMGRAI